MIPILLLATILTPADTLRLGPGIHHGPLVLERTTVVLAEPGAVLRGSGTGTVLEIRGPGSVVRGLRIERSGRDPDQYDAGVLVAADSLTLDLPRQYRAQHRKIYPTARGAVAFTGWTRWTRADGEAFDVGMMVEAWCRGGGPISEIVSEIATEIEIGQSFIDRCVLALNAGELTAEEAAMAKWWCTELQGKVVDRGVQLHGGYGYMTEYPIGRAYADARITRIYGGTTEIMKEIIGRSLDLDDRKLGRG